MEGQGISVDDKALDQFFKLIDETNVVDAVKEGEKKHIKMPCGGGGGVAVAAATGGAAAADEPKKEEPKEEAEDVDMGGLFGDDEDDY